MGKVRFLNCFVTLLLLGFIKSEGQKPAPLIDMHLHVYSKETFQSAPFDNDGISLKSPADWNSHLNKVIEKMDSNNIVLSYASGDFEIIDYLNRNYPGRFLPSIQISPTPELLANKKYLDELRKKIRKKEILGIGEVLNFYTGMSPDDPAMDTIYRIAQEFDIPVGLHFAPGPTGVQSWGGYYAGARYRYSNPLLMEDVLVKFPKLRVNIMHAGVPAFTEETFAMFEMFPNVYADIGFLAVWSDYMRASLKKFLQDAVVYGFTDRIMFGSDAMVWPEAIDLAIDFIRNADYLTEKQKEDILYNNAARFLSLKSVP